MAGFIQSIVRDEAARLSVPATRDYVRVIRLAASGIATNLGFDIDELDDLRVGVGELANLALERCKSDPNQPETLEVVFTISGDELRIEGSVAAADNGAIELEALTRQILEAVVDSYSIQIVDGTIRFTCTRRPW